MTQIKNYYVIVGRDGTRPVTRWSPIAAHPAGESDAYNGQSEPIRGQAASKQDEFRDEPAR